MGRALLLAALAGSTGCGRGLMSVILDLPPEAPRADSARTVSTAPPWPGALAFYVDSVRPPIEETLDPDSVRALLPRDHAGNIDWMEALRSGVIKPRSVIPGDSTARPPSSFEFGFDFYFPGPSPTFDAFFPHSAHTDWAACEHCHTRIFRYRDTQMQMGDVLEGKYCGECHGTVAFPVSTGCERCHTDLPQPPDRAQPDFIGDIELTRVERENDRSEADTSSVPGGAPGARPGTPSDSVALPPPDSAEGVGVAVEQARIQVNLSLPNARFPHWVHRIRYRCKVCHVEIFEPKAGANRITMDDIARGEACGRCHDGKTAFTYGFGECHRCHPDEADEGAQAPGS